jgi:hypothetical protein
VAVRAEVRDNPAAGLAGATRDHHPHVGTSRPLIFTPIATDRHS